MLTFFTPSYAGDLDRFILLRKSMERFYRGNARHVVAVPKEDLRLFKRNAPNDGDIEYVTQNELVDKAFFPPWWYRQAKQHFPSQAWRLDRFKGRSGWIIQIMTKLSIPSVIQTGVVALLDSDLVFVRDFENADMGDPERQQVLVRIVAQTESGKQRHHVEKSRSVFGISPGSTEHHYMSSPNIWYPEWVKALHVYLEERYSDRWQHVLFQAGHISAYTLYGIFVEEVLKPSQLVLRDRQFHRIVWDMASYHHFLSDPSPVNDDTLCIVIQSNLGIGVEEYSRHIEALWRQAERPGH